MSEAAREFTVVVAHAPGDAEVASAIVAGLRGRRHRAEAVGVADSDAPLLEACAKQGGQGFFVLVRTKGLPAARVEALRIVLRDLGVPMSRSLGLGLEGLTADSFTDRVINIVRRIAPDPSRLGPLPTAPVEVAPAATPEPLADRLEPRATSPAVPGPSPAIHSAAIAVDATHLGTSPRRRAAFGAGALALAAVVVWAVAPRANDRDASEAAPASLGGAESAAKAPGELAARPVDGERDTPRASKVETAAAAPQPTAVSVAAPAAADAADPATEDSEAIVAALRKREIRALDVFVVSPESKKPASFAGASAYCAALDVAGIKDWRLPEIGELISMSRAKMVRKGSFWSSTKGDTFGDLRLVLVVKRERLSPIPAGWDGGRVICVRERS